MSKGRLFKFMIDTLPINNSMDNFLFNIVKNRPRQEIYITGNKVKINSLKKDDYIFIQSNGYITHYMRCKDDGPIFYNNNKDREISVKDIKKISNPIKSHFIGQGYNKLNEDEIKNILIKI